MKKMKKILAMLLALTMLMGLGMTAMAETNVTAPSKTDKAVAEVLGVEAPRTVDGVELNPTVKAYQIVKGKYNDNGLIGYEKVNDSLTISNFPYPSYDDVMQIAANISNENNPLGLPCREFTYDTTTGSYKTNEENKLETGYWIVLVTGTGSTIYNPMLMGVYYKVEGESEDKDNVLFAESVNAGNSWTLEAQKTVAKKTTTTIEKEADVNTQNTGGDVNFTVETKVPQYSTGYTNVLFKVTDTLTRLTLKQDTVKVYAGTKEEVKNKKAVEIANTNYTLSTSEESLEVNFESEWVLKNGDEDITITYTATIDADALNEVPGENHVELFYTNNPGEEKGYDEDKEKVYSFTLDVFKKVKEDNTTALDGAEFKLFTDGACKVEYSNDQFENPVISNSDGRMAINGLNVGTYYFKETKAPAGYTLNTTVYKVDVAAVITSDDELTSWTVTVTPIVDGKNGEAVTNTYTVVQGEVVEGEEATVTFERNGADVKITNTKLINLPSTGGIGTTIFTVAGCGIMIAAAFFFFASRKKENE